MERYHGTFHPDFLGDAEPFESLEEAPAGSAANPTADAPDASPPSRPPPPRPPDADTTPVDETVGQLTDLLDQTPGHPPMHRRPMHPSAGWVPDSTICRRASSKAQPTGWFSASA